jgi:hypothetical protein
MRYLQYALPLIVIGLLSSCSPSSQITGSWINPKGLAKYSDIMVAGMCSSVEAKNTVETDLAAALTGKGIQVTKSLDVFPPNFGKDITKEEMLSKIRNKGSDAILTVTLVDKTTESRYSPGTMAYAPMPIYSRFWGYYSYWYPTMYNSPGYYTQDRVYYLETNLYDARSEDLVWSAQSETYNPKDLSGFSQSLANQIVNKLEKDGLLQSSKLNAPSKRTAARNR